MQRFNYLLFGVALLHTLSQQANNERSALMVVGVLALTIGVMVAQSIGFVIYRKREQQRKPAVSAPTAARPSAVPTTAPQSGPANRVVAPRYTASAATRPHSPLPKMAMFGIAGLFAIFGGFEIGQVGSQVVNSVVHASTSTTASTSNSSSTSTVNNSSTSSSSSSQVNSVSSSQPSVTTKHS